MTHLEMETEMEDKSEAAFIIDCPNCRAKVAAREGGRVTRGGWVEELGEPWGECVLIGSCPKCATLLAGTADQTSFAGYQGDEQDEWGAVVRVYPMPSRAFSSVRIPKVVTDSLNEAERSLQAGANIAGCVMLGRALEALCRDVIHQHENAGKRQQSETLAERRPKQIMLGAGIKKLRDLKVIDDRLFDWSQQLQAFRNLAAHPEDISISREDADDLQVFAHAIVEYVYELADRYDDFKARAERREKRKKPRL
jgi:hypothetical protein